MTVAVSAFELYECLAVGRRCHINSAGVPLAGDEIALGLQLLEQSGSTLL